LRQLKNKSNIDVFDFILTENEMEQIRALDTSARMHDTDFGKCISSHSTCMRMTNS